MGAISKCINCTTPGFRFHPNDVELINHLKNKMIGLEPRGREIVEVADLSKLNPWELRRILSSGTIVDDDDDESWFFYWKLVHKKNGVSRTAKGGFWKPTGKVRPIRVRGTREKIGEKRTLVFHLGTSSGKVTPSQRTPWVIHEYYCIDTLPGQTEKVVKDVVLCKLKLKDDGKTEISSNEVSESSCHLPSNSTLAKPHVEESRHSGPSDSKKNMMKNGEDDASCYSPFNCQESVVENPEVVPDKVSAKGTCESIRNSPHHKGDSAAEDVVTQENIDELLAQLEFLNDCNVGDGCIPDLPLVPREQLPAFKNTGQSVNSEKDDHLGSFPDCNEGSLRDGSNQLKMINNDQGFNLPYLTGSPPLVVSSRKRSHDEDDGLSCVTNSETPQAKRARVVRFSKNGADEKACCQAFPEDEQGGLHMTSGLQNKTSEYTKPEADCASMIDNEEQDLISASPSVLHKQGVPTKGLENEHDWMLEHGVYLNDFYQSAPSSMYQDIWRSEIGNIGPDKYFMHGNTDLDVYSCQGTPYIIDDAYILASPLESAFLEYNSNANTGIYNPLVMTNSPMSAPVGEYFSNCT